MSGIEIEVSAKVDKVQRDMETLNHTVSDITKNVGGMVNGFKNLVVGGAAVGSLLMMAKVAKDITVEFGQLENKIAAVTDRTAAMGEALSGVSDIAKSTQTTLSDTAATFAALGSSAASLKPSTEALLTATKAIQAASTIAGGNLEGFKAAVFQLSQGLGAGVLRGEEFNSVMEQALPLAGAIADSLHVSTGELRQMAAAGKLTSEQVFGALIGQAGALEAKLANITPTLDAQMGRVKESFKTTFDEFLKGTGYTTQFSQALGTITNKVGDVTKSAFEMGMALRDGVDAFREKWGMAIKPALWFFDIIARRAKAVLDAFGITAFFVRSFASAELAVSHFFNVFVVRMGSVGTVLSSLENFKTTGLTGVFGSLEKSMGMSLKATMSSAGLFLNFFETSFLAGIRAQMSAVGHLLYSSLESIGLSKALKLDAFVFFGAKLNTVLSTIVSFTKSSFSKLARAMSRTEFFYLFDTFGLIGKGIKALIPEDALSGLLNFLDDLADKLDINKVFLNAAAGARHFLREAADFIDLIPGLTLFTSTLRKAAKVAGNFTGLKGLGGNLKNLVTGLRFSLDTTSFGAVKIVVMRLIRDLVKSVSALAKKGFAAINLGKLSFKLKDLFPTPSFDLSALQSYFSKGFKAFKDWATALISRFSLPDVDILGKLKTVMDAVHNFVKDRLAALTSTLPTLSFGDFFTKTVEAIEESLPSLDDVVGYIKGFYEKVVHYFFLIYDEVIAHSWWTDLVIDVVDGAKEMVSTVAKYISAFADYVIAAFKTVYDAGSKLFGKIADSFNIDTLQAKLSGVAASMAAAFTSFKSGKLVVAISTGDFKGVGSALKEIGHNMANSSGVIFAKAVLLHLTGKFLPSLLPKGDILGLLEGAVKRAGQRAWMQLASSLKDTDLAKNLANMSGSAVGAFLGDTFASFVDNLPGTISLIFGVIASGMRAMLENLGGVIGPAFQGLFKVADTLELGNALGLVGGILFGNNVLNVLKWMGIFETRIQGLQDKLEPLMKFFTGRFRSGMTGSLLQTLSREMFGGARKFVFLGAAALALDFVGGFDSVFQDQPIGHAVFDALAMAMMAFGKDLPTLMSRYVTTPFRGILGSGLRSAGLTSLGNWILPTAGPRASMISVASAMISGVHDLFTTRAAALMRPGTRTFMEALLLGRSVGSIPPALRAAIPAWQMALIAAERAGRHSIRTSLGSIVATTPVIGPMVAGLQSLANTMRTSTTAGGAFARAMSSLVRPLTVVAMLAGLFASMGAFAAEDQTVKVDVKPTESPYKKMMEDIRGPLKSGLDAIKEVTSVIWDNFVMIDTALIGGVALLKIFGFLARVSEAAILSGASGTALIGLALRPATSGFAKLAAGVQFFSMQTRVAAVLIGSLFTVLAKLSSEDALAPLMNNIGESVGDALNIDNSGYLDKLHSISSATGDFFKSMFSFLDQSKKLATWGLIGALVGGFGFWGVRMKQLAAEARIARRELNPMQASNNFVGPRVPGSVGTPTFIGPMNAGFNRNAPYRGAAPVVATKSSAGVRMAGGALLAADLLGAFDSAIDPDSIGHIFIRAAAGALVLFGRTLTDGLLGMLGKAASPWGLAIGGIIAAAIFTGLKMSKTEDQGGVPKGFFSELMSLETLSVAAFGVFAVGARKAVLYWGEIRAAAEVARVAQTASLAAFNVQQAFVGPLAPGMPGYVGAPTMFGGRAYHAAGAPPVAPVVGSFTARAAAAMAASPLTYMPATMMGKAMPMMTKIGATAGMAFAAGFATTELFGLKDYGTEATLIGGLIGWNLIGGLITKITPILSTGLAGMFGLLVVSGGLLWAYFSGNGTLSERMDQAMHKMKEIIGMGTKLRKNTGDGLDAPMTAFAKDNNFSLNYDMTRINMDILSPKQRNKLEGAFDKFYESMSELKKKVDEGEEITPADRDATQRKLGNLERQYARALSETRFDFKGKMPDIKSFEKFEGFSNADYAKAILENPGTFASAKLGRGAQSQKDWKEARKGIELFDGVKKGVELFERVAKSSATNSVTPNLTTAINGVSATTFAAMKELRDNMAEGSTGSLWGQRSNAQLEATSKEGLAIMAALQARIDAEVAVSQQSILFGKELTELGNRMSKVDLKIDWDVTSATEDLRNQLSQATFALDYWTKKLKDRNSGDTPAKAVTEDMFKAAGLVLPKKDDPKYVTMNRPAWNEQQRQEYADVTAYSEYAVPEMATGVEYDDAQFRADTADIMKKRAALSKELAAPDMAASARVHDESARAKMYAKQEADRAIEWGALAGSKLSSTLANLSGKVGIELPAGHIALGDKESAAVKDILKGVSDTLARLDAPEISKQEAMPDMPRQEDFTKEGKSQWTRSGFTKTSVPDFEGYEKAMTAFTEMQKQMALSVADKEKAASDPEYASKLRSKAANDIFDKVNGNAAARALNNQSVFESNSIDPSRVNARYGANAAQDASAKIQREMLIQQFSKGVDKSAFEASAKRVKAIMESIKIPDYQPLLAAVNSIDSTITGESLQFLSKEQLAALDKAATDIEIIESKLKNSELLPEQSAALLAEKFKIIEESSKITESIYHRIGSKITEAMGKAGFDDAKVAANQGMSPQMYAAGAALTAAEKDRGKSTSVSEWVTRSLEVHRLTLEVQMLNASLALTGDEMAQAFSDIGVTTAAAMSKLDGKLPFALFRAGRRAKVDLAAASDEASFKRAMKEGAVVERAKLLLTKQYQSLKAGFESAKSALSLSFDESSFGRVSSSLMNTLINVANGFEIALSDAMSNPDLWKSLTAQMEILKDDAAILSGLDTIAKDVANSKRESGKANYDRVTAAKPNLNLSRAEYSFVPAADKAAFTAEADLQRVYDALDSMTLTPVLADTADSMFKNGSTAKEISDTLSKIGGDDFTAKWGDAYKASLSPLQLNSTATEENTKAILSWTSMLQAKPATAVPAVDTAPAKLEKTDYAIHKSTPFAQDMLTRAKPYADKLGLPADALVAQSAWETGWGKAIRTKEGGGSTNNLFNIKATKNWKGGRSARPATDGGYFRAYESLEDSLADYVALIQKAPRYAKAVIAAKAGDVNQYFKELQAAGYAGASTHYASDLSKLNVRGKAAARNKYAVPDETAKAAVSIKEAAKKPAELINASFQEVSNQVAASSEQLVDTVINIKERAADETQHLAGRVTREKPYDRSVAQYEADFEAYKSDFHAKRRVATGNEGLGIEPIAYNLADIAQSAELTTFAEQIKLAKEALDSATNAEDAAKAQEALLQYQSGLESLTTSIMENAKSIENAGKSFKDGMKGFAESTFKDLLEGNTKGIGKKMLDGFTGHVTDTLSKGLAASFGFGRGGMMDKMMERTGSMLFAGPGSLLGSIPGVGDLLSGLGGGSLVGKTPEDTFSSAVDKFAASVGLMGAGGVGAAAAAASSGGIMDTIGSVAPWLLGGAGVIGAGYLLKNGISQDVLKGAGYGKADIGNINTLFGSSGEDFDPFNASLFDSKSDKTSSFLSDLFTEKSRGELTSSIKSAGGNPWLDDGMKSVIAGKSDGMFDWLIGDDGFLGKNGSIANIFSSKTKEGEGGMLDWLIGDNGIWGFLKKMIMGENMDGTGGLVGGIASIWSSLGFAEGGHVSGPGTSKSDSIPAMLSDGEFVVNAKATRKHAGLLQAINSGSELVHRAEGGFIGTAMSLASPIMSLVGSINASSANAELEKAAKELQKAALMLMGGGKGGVADGISSAMSKALPTTKGDKGMFSGITDWLGITSPDTSVDMSPVAAAEGSLTDTLDKFTGKTTTSAMMSPVDAKGLTSKLDEMTKPDSGFFSGIGDSISSWFDGGGGDAASGLTRVPIEKTADFMNASPDIQSALSSALPDGITAQNSSLSSVLGGGKGGGGLSSLFGGGSSADSFVGPMQPDQGMFSGLSTMMDDMTTMMDDMLGGLMDSLSGLMDGLMDGLSGAMSGIMDGLSGALGGIGDLLGGAGGGIMDGLSGLGGMFMGMFADGGHVSGPGTSTSDSIPALLSNGEFVVNAKATAQHAGLLKAINSGSVIKRAMGGGVGSIPTSPAILTTPTMASNTAAAKAGEKAVSNKSSVVNMNITGDISRQTRSEIYKMLPDITQGVNNNNKESNYRS
jgi:tape measure domain-containing protein